MRIPVGSTVKLSGKFLRDTGQVIGGEGCKRWTTVECGCGLCLGGSYVAVNEDSGWGSARHINTSNLILAS